MRKIMLSIITMLLCAFVNAQELPKIIPSSPEASSLGKYGDLPVNLASGRINYSVPIFTIKEGEVELPIYLSYNYSGLLAEEDPGLVGLGWTLHAGGMLTRQLRGKPDETPGIGYVGGNIGKNWVAPFNYSLWNNKSIEEQKNNKSFLFEGASSGTIDTQPDKFNISAGSISGSFSYNALGEPIFTPHKNYKVINPSTNKYVVTDDQGIKYTFSEPERNFVEYIVPNDGNSPPYLYTSSWKLSKIESKKTNKVINFEYVNGASYSKTSYSESRSELLLKSGPDLNNSKCVINPNQIDQSRVVSTMEEIKHLSKIVFSQGNIEFDVKTVPSNSQSTNKNYLNAILIKDKYGKVISTYEFIYDNLLSNFKLIKKIKKIDKDNKEIPFYSFEYKETPPTAIHYASQDAWGYYNGKTNFYLAKGNRSVDFNKSVLGALTKIIYPTRGYTEISYEPNKVVLLENENLVGGQCTTTPLNKKEEIKINQVNLNASFQEKTIQIKKDQVVRVYMETRASTNTSGIVEANVKIEGVMSCNTYSSCNTSGCSREFVTASEMGVYTTANGNQSKEVYFSVKKDETITIKAKLFGANATGVALISVEYFDPSSITPSQNFINVGGIRIKSTKDCESTGDCISRNYKYVLENGLSSGTLLSEPRFTHNIDYIAPTIQCKIKRVSSQSKIPMASFQGAPVLYKRVETLINDELTNGKTVKYFSYELNPSPGFPFPPINRKDWKKGNLIKEEVFGNENNQLRLLKKTENTYVEKYPYSADYNLNKYSIGLLAGRVRSLYGNVISPSNPGVTLELLQLGNPDDYKEKSFIDRPEFYHLSRTKVTNYIENQEQVSITNYVNDNLTGYLKEQHSTNSNGEVLKTKMLYAGDLNDVVLINENRLAEQLETKSYNNNELLLHQKTVYANFGNLYLPSKVKTSKSTLELEDRVIYHSYDDKGNPTEVSKKDGTHIVYIWGYEKTQPVAKIENAKLSDIPSATIISIQNASNLDKDAASENTLRTTLNALRLVPALSKSQITTFTYNPLVGVTSISDPRGQTMYYEYDSFNRLKYVRDNEGKLLKETKYNYKN